MLNYNPPINEAKNYSELKISEIEPITKINLRGKNRDFITKIGKELSIIPPSDPNTSSGNEKLNILWLSPDEWLVYSNDKIYLNERNALLEKLFDEISKVKLGSVTDVSDHWVMINLKVQRFLNYYLPVVLLILIILKIQKVQLLKPY